MPDNNYYLLLNEIKNLQGEDSEQINLDTVFDIHKLYIELLSPKTSYHDKSKKNVKKRDIVP